MCFTSAVLKQMLFIILTRLMIKKLLQYFQLAERFFFSGKWSRIERLDCREDFLKMLWAKLPSVFVNSAKECPHRKPRATALSWKCYNLKESKAALYSSSTLLLLSKAFKGDEEVSDISSQVTGSQVIALAKARARGQKDPQNMCPTCKAHHCTIAPRGKIALHYYVGKVLL